MGRPGLRLGTKAWHSRKVFESFRSFDSTLGSSSVHCAAHARPRITMIILGNESIRAKGRCLLINANYF